MIQDCDLNVVSEPRPDGRVKYKCARCGMVAGYLKPPPQRIRMTCRIAQYGPGEEMKKVILEFAPQGCKSGMCPERAATMNRWGVEGCQENRATIVGWLKESAGQLSWLDTAKSGAVLLSKPWFDPLRPFDSILDEAIRRDSERTPNV